MGAAVYQLQLELLRTMIALLNLLPIFHQLHKRAHVALWASFSRLEGMYR